MSRADANIAQARLAAAYLDEIGQPKHANAVVAILQSLSSSRTTNSVLHRDNVELRRRIAEIEWRGHP